MANEPTEASDPPGSSERSGTWLGAGGLLFFTVLAAVVSPGVLVGIPFLLLVLVLPSRSVALLVAAMLAVLWVVDAGPGDGFWYLERGWAVLLGGWFLGLTLRWPESPFFPRALAAVAGSFVVAALIFLVRPNSWTVVEWLVSNEMRMGVSAALGAFSVLQGPDALSQELTDAVYRTVEIQEMIFPALLGLSSLAALGVAWWAWIRFGSSDEAGLGPLSRFRFNDQLVWVLILGVFAVLVGAGEAVERVGTNAVVFMGLLYALRGAGVLLFINGGLSVAGGILVGLVFLFTAPWMAGGAMIVGLGDTWFDLRKRVAAAGGPSDGQGTSGTDNE